MSISQDLLLYLYSIYNTSTDVMCSNHKVQMLCVPTTKYRRYVFQPQSTDVMCSNHKVLTLCVPTTKYRRVPTTKRHKH